MIFEQTCLASVSLVERGIGSYPAGTLELEAGVVGLLGRGGIGLKKFGAGTGGVDVGLRKGQ